MVDGWSHDARYPHAAFMIDDSDFFRGRMSDAKGSGDATSTSWTRGGSGLWLFCHQGLVQRDAFRVVCCQVVCE